MSPAEAIGPPRPVPSEYYIRMSISSRHVDLNKSAANVPIRRRTTSIAPDDALILSHRANPARIAFSETTADVFDCIERFYNSKRRHSMIGYLSPMEYERKAEFA